MLYSTWHSIKALAPNNHVIHVLSTDDWTELDRWSTEHPSMFDRCIDNYRPIGHNSTGDRTINGRYSSDPNWWSHDHRSMIGRQSSNELPIKNRQENRSDFLKGRRVRRPSPMLIFHENTVKIGRSSPDNRLTVGRLAKNGHRPSVARSCDCSITGLSHDRPTSRAILYKLIAHLI